MKYRISVESDDGFRVVSPFEVEDADWDKSADAFAFAMIPVLSATFHGDGPGPCEVVAELLTNLLYFADPDDSWTVLYDIGKLMTLPDSGEAISSLRAAVKELRKKYEAKP